MGRAIQEAIEFTVRDGIRMAQKLAPMDIMMLPVVYRGDAS